MTHYIKVFHLPEYVALNAMICNTHNEENVSVCQYTGRKYLMRHLTKQTKIHSYNVNISKVALQMFGYHCFLPLHVWRWTFEKPKPDYVDHADIVCLFLGGK